jgi:two-component system nitrogen regulation response regulator GlnG
LRALEAREIQPVGGEPIKLDLRIVSATDADLDAGVTDESFKTALRHRLSRFEIRLPSLRQRRSDIAVLARDFLELEFTGQGEPGRLLRDADDPQLVYHWAQLFLRLSRYNWPGNVRELRNVITQIVINSLDQGEVILPSHVDELLVASQQVVSSKPEAQPRTLSESADLEVSVDAVRDVLKMSRWEVAPTARALGVSRQRVYRVIEQEEDLRTAADLRVEEVQASFRACDGNLDTMCDELQVSRSGLQRRLRDVF